MHGSALLVGLSDTSTPLIQSCLAELHLAAVSLDDAGPGALPAPGDHALVLCELPASTVSAEELRTVVRPQGVLTPVLLVAGRNGAPAPSVVARWGAEECVPHPLDRGHLTRAIARALLKREVLKYRSNGGANSSSGDVLLYASKALTRCLEAKDESSVDHARTVAQIAGSLAQYYGLDEWTVEAAQLAGALHDLGKVSVSGEILRKPGWLSSSEWQEVRRHPEVGAEILGSVDAFAEVAVYVLHHHERHDGEGYPAGLRNGQIPLVSRIIAAADAYDAMVRPRPYREREGAQYAAHQLRAHAGTQWDPEVVNGMFECVPQLQG